MKTFIDLFEGIKMLSFYILVTLVGLGVVACIVMMAAAVKHVTEIEEKILRLGNASYVATRDPDSIDNLDIGGIWVNLLTGRVFIAVRFQDNKTFWSKIDARISEDEKKLYKEALELDGASESKERLKQVKPCQ